MNHHDKYIAAAQEQWPNIFAFYQLFEDKKPVMLLDLRENRIYAYPYIEFKAALNETSQKILEKQYHEAITKDKVVIFVRDNEAEKLISFCFDLDVDKPQPKTKAHPAAAGQRRKGTAKKSVKRT